MMWSFPGPPTWDYALMTASMILFWTLVVFGAIVLVHHLGRDVPFASASDAALAVGRPGPPSADTAMVVQIRIPTKTITPIASATQTGKTSRPDVAVAREDDLDPLHRSRQM